MTIADISHATGMSARLINEYVNLITEFGLPNLNESSTPTPKKTKTANGTKKK